jgi:hypothetical protein
MAFSADHPGVWRYVFVHALKLMRDMQLHTQADALWTFGGSTVLMLRHAHWLSKDIDLFVPDVQYLGFEPMWKSWQKKCGIAAIKRQLVIYLT